MTVTTYIILSGSFIVLLQHHMSYCEEYAARHAGVQDVLHSYIAEYGPPHAELNSQEHVSCMPQHCYVTFHN